MVDPGLILVIFALIGLGWIWPLVVGIQEYRKNSKWNGFLWTSSIWFVGVVIFVITVGYIYVQALRSFFEEDRVPHVYDPVIHAIYAYSDTNQVAPEKLEMLVPDFLEALPSDRENDVVSYVRAMDQTNWMLSVTADLRTRKARWIYHYASDPDLAPTGNVTRVGRIHLWGIYLQE